MTVTHLDMTLAEADAEWSLMLGRPAGLEQAVRDLVWLSKADKVLGSKSPYRMKYLDLAERAVRRGMVEHDGYVLKAVRGKSGGGHRVLKSALERVRPDLVEQCVRTRKIVRRDGPLWVAEPELPGGGMLADLHHAYVNELGRFREVDRRKDAARDVIVGLAVEDDEGGGWNGSKMVFSDGFEVSVATQRAFSGQALKVVAPELWDQLAEPAPVTEYVSYQWREKGMSEDAYAE